LALVAEPVNAATTPTMTAIRRQVEVARAPEIVSLVRMPFPCVSSMSLGNVRE
jgi:hypothetical protein